MNKRSLISDHKHLFVECSDYLLEIHELQLAGKKRMSACDFMNGIKNINSLSII